MKKTVLILVFLCFYALPALAQDWFTSFEVAKRMALAQDKMLLVLWEESISEPYFVTAKDARGNLIFIDLTRSQWVNETIWEYFVPLLLPEDAYGAFIDDVEGLANLTYRQKLEDDSIKIMDANGRILNVRFSSLSTENLQELIDLYALNTSYINSYLRNYRDARSFNTTMALGSKYLDYSIFAKTDRTRRDLVRLGELYFKEARNLMDGADPERDQAFLQKMELLEAKSALILGSPKRARRILKKYEVSDVNSINTTLYNFLNYTTFTILKDDDAATVFEGRVEEADKRRAALIVNIN